jgi:hypothetical protein
MRNLLALIGLLVVVFAAVGWYCGWYKLSVSRGDEGKIQINTDVDTQKLSEDSSAFFKKVGSMIGDKTDKSGQPASAPVNTPGPVTPSNPVNTNTPPDASSSAGWFGTPLKAPTGGGTQ